VGPLEEFELVLHLVDVSVARQQPVLPGELSERPDLFEISPVISGGLWDLLCDASLERPNRVKEYFDDVVARFGDPFK
jgi:hypothetical protein